MALPTAHRDIRTTFTAGYGEGTVPIPCHIDVVGTVARMESENQLQWFARVVISESMGVMPM